MTAQGKGLMKDIFKWFGIVISIAGILIAIGGFVAETKATTEDLKKDMEELAAHEKADNDIQTDLKISNAKILQSLEDVKEIQRQTLKEVRRANR